MRLVGSWFRDATLKVLVSLSVLNFRVLALVGSGSVVLEAWSLGLGLGLEVRNLGLEY